MESWQPCNPLHRHPAYAKNAAAKREGIHHECICQLLARGCGMVEAWLILYPQHAPERTIYERVNNVLDANDRVARARMQYLRSKLGVPSDMSGEFTRETLVRGLVERLSHCKTDRDYATLAGVLSKVCGYDAPQKIETSHAIPSLTEVIRELDERHVRNALPVAVDVVDVLYVKSDTYSSVKSSP